MKKVLIVEDTLENLETAKAFFSTIEGFEFVYAMNRKDAEKLLPSIDALITDRSLPYSEDSLIGCDFPEEKKDMVEEAEVRANGFALLFSALLLNKPAIMASEHQGLMIFKGVTTSSVEEILQRIHINTSYEDIRNLRKYGGNEGTFLVNDVKKTLTTHGAPKDVKKTEIVAWQMAWEELQKQF